MRLMSRLTSSATTKSTTPQLLSSSSSTFCWSLCCCARHLNKKIFIAFVILILTLSGCCIWLNNNNNDDNDVDQQVSKHHRQQQQQWQQQWQQLPQNQKVGQTNLLPNLELHQFHEKVNATSSAAAKLTKSNDKNVFSNAAAAGDSSRQQQQQHQQQQHQRIDSLKYEPRHDWHNYEAIAKDAERSPNDLGEFGKAAYLKTGSDDDDDDEDGDDIKSKISKSLQEFGFNLPLSDAISLQRALSDLRHEHCQHQSYHAYLPTVSIIIVYHNEQRSVLLRTLYSLINRTPEKLLQEILLIDDDSDANILGADFEQYLHEHFENKTKLIHAPQRLGLIKARLLGARKAQGEVLVFLDAHIEATHNWLAPLLEPIYEDAKSCTTPLIDTINYENFAYTPTTPSRGGFNWQFNYVQLPLGIKERLNLPHPHENPVMNGGLFAIKAKFFWQLGGYDEGLEIWGAEQFELSFKIWMCGGRLLEVPCSRLGHLYRSPKYQVKYTNRTDDFISKNYKRIAEVWLDSYKEYLYEQVPKLNTIDAGDLSTRKALRKNLHCKGFKWFLETIAPDLLALYPPLEPVDFARGAIQSMAAPKLCLDSLNSQTREMVGFLRDCSPDLRHPYATQRWSLSFRRDLRDSNGNCLEPQTWSKHAPIWLWPCHNRGGNQWWYYDRFLNLLVQGNGANGTERRCLDADLIAQRAFLNYCDFTKPTMKWHFGYVNQTAMDSFFKDNINLS